MSFDVASGWASTNVEKLWSADMDRRLVSRVGFSLGRFGCWVSFLQG